MILGLVSVHDWLVSAEIIGVARAQATTPKQTETPKQSDERPPFDQATRNRYATQIRQRAPEQRIAAIRELGEFRDLEAVRLILQHGLRERTPAVHDAATEALLKSRDHKEIERFLLDQLLLELAGKRRGSPEYQERLIEALGRFATPHVIRQLFALREKLDAPGREQFLAAILHGIDQRAALGEASFTGVLYDLAGSPQFSDYPGLRRCVVHAAIVTPHKDALELLVRLWRETDGELRHDIDQHLRRVTQHEPSLDPDAWQRWWQANRRDFVYPTELAKQPAPADQAQGAPLYYYNLPIHARRIVFVLDTSRSMGASGAVSRLEAAKRELATTIEKLPDDTLFTVIAFNSEVHRWQDRLRTATAGNKALAASFVRSQKPNGKTATYDAVHAAFEIDANLEAIYFLSDGAPSDGTIVAPQTVLATIRQENRTRRLKIHTLGAFGGQQAAGLEEFMRQLAEQNDGQFRRLD